MILNSVAFLCGSALEWCQPSEGYVEIAVHKYQVDVLFVFAADEPVALFAYLAQFGFRLGIALAPRLGQLHKFLQIWRNYGDHVGSVLSVVQMLEGFRRAVEDAHSSRSETSRLRSELLIGQSADRMTRRTDSADVP